jgi:hypothetical protein
MSEYWQFILSVYLTLKMLQLLSRGVDWIIKYIDLLTTRQTEQQSALTMTNCVEIAKLFKDIIKSTE